MRLRSVIDRRIAVLLAGVFSLFAGSPAGAQMAPTPSAAVTPGAPQRRVLALSLKQAILRGLKNNLDLAVERVSVEIARAGQDVPRGEYDPLLYSDGSYGKSRDPFFSANPFGGPVNPITGLPSGLIVNPTDSDHWDAGVRQKTPLGTALEVRYSIDRRTTENIFALSPAWSPAATVSLSQPLLRGFGPDVNLALIRIAQNDRRISEAAFEDRALTTAFLVEQAYWNVVFAREKLKVAELALGTANDLVEINKQKFQAGSVAEVEVLVAQTGVATREEAVIVARNDVLNARDTLLQLILPVAALAPDRGAVARRASEWDVDLLPLDEPRADDAPVDVERAFFTALDKRPDYRQLSIAGESDEIRIARASNERWPRLDAVASWSELGLGTNWPNGSNEQLGGTFYDWSVGFVFELPLFDTTARAHLRQAELGKRQTGLRRASLEQAIILDVRTAVRDLAAARERVKATELARTLAVRQLDDQKKRLLAGVVTNHDVLLFENDLTLARTNFVKAEIDRAVARARLERVTATLLQKHDIRFEADVR